MPKIPSILAERDVYTGETGRMASPSSFAPSLGPVAAGLESLGQGVGNLSAAEAAIEHRKKVQSDSRWATESVMQERMFLSEWMSKAENNESEEFSNTFKELALGRMRDYQSKAPSPEAADSFAASMGDWVSRQHTNALHVTERTRLNNAILSYDNSISDALKSFRDAQRMPNNTALIDLEDSLRILHDSIETQFGKVSPATTQKLQNHLVKQAVLGIAPTHPEDARRILDASNVVDEGDRKTLLNFIEQSTNTRNIVSQDQFNQDRKDHLAASYFGKTREKIPLSLYRSYYPDERAQVMKRQDDEVVDTYNSANDFVSGVSGKSPGAQVRELEKLLSSASTERDQQVLDIVRPKIRDNLQHMQRDRVGWMIANNPTIQSVEKQIAQAVTPEEQASLMSQRNEWVLHFQGTAPADSPDKERDYYLGLASQDRHLMSLDEAVGSAAQINRSSPAEAVQAISRIVSKYPNATHQSIVFNDMVNLSEGRGIKQEYQLAFQNRQAWWVDTYLAAVGNAKDLAKLDEEGRKKILNEIERQPIWGQFQSSLVGDDMSRATEVEGFKTGILAYTHALSVQGKPLKQAAREATQMLIGETLGFARVNGQSLVVARDRPGKIRRTDEEVQDIGRRLNVALQFIDPREVDSRSFPGLVNAGPQDGIGQMQALRDIVTAKGFFVTGNDGQSASLHVRDDHGFPFEVTDKRGFPFVIHFEDLPEFMNETGEYVGTSMGPGEVPTMSKVKYPQRPSKTYDLTTGGGFFSKLFGSGQIQTNWPSTVPWIHHQAGGAPKFRVPAEVVPPPAEDPQKLLEGDAIKMLDEAREGR